jgi:hypothetical protein
MQSFGWLRDPEFGKKKSFGPNAGSMGEGNVVVSKPDGRRRLALVLPNRRAKMVTCCELEGGASTWWIQEYLS